MKKIKLATPMKKGPMDNFIIKKTDNQTETRSRRLSFKPGKKEDEAHRTHTFQWCSSDKKPTIITCNKAGTVEDSLKTSPQFKEIAKKNKGKELVVVRSGRAISSDFPCCLIQQDERLIVKYIKAADKPLTRSGDSDRTRRKGSSDKLITFHLQTRGGKNVVNVMRYAELKIEIQEITVYAFKGEKVKEALKKDGRISNVIFKKNCVLSDLSTDVNTEMSNLVDDLDGKTFKIIRLRGSCPPDSQPSSLDDAYMTASERKDSDENQNPTSEPEKDVSKEKPVEVPEEVMRKIPNSKQMRDQLSSRFNQAVEAMKTQKFSKLSNVQNLFRVEFGKNDESCREVKTMKKLMKHSNSVCQVRINGSAVGSGFLLFKDFVLTNGHVIKNVYDQDRGRLRERTTVHFSFESLEDAGPEIGAEVNKVVAFEYRTNDSGYLHDWALLRVSADQTLPVGLLSHSGFVPSNGGICIIGHPGGGVKKIDPCYVIPLENRIQAAEKQYHENAACIQSEPWYYEDGQGIMQLVTPAFFEGTAKHVSQKQVLTYDSCFYHGSSGSPVFDEHCNVVAMHSGGYAYNNAKWATKSVIEYGQLLSLIIEQILKQLEINGRTDVLKEFSFCNNPRFSTVMEKVKEQFESGNITAFKDAANRNEAVDETIRTVFECSSHENPMETD